MANDMKAKLQALSDPLPIESIEFRIQSISEKGWAVMLAYKDARVDMARLDECVGRENWQRHHRDLGGTKYCGIAINIDGAWVEKWDAGEASNQHSEKGAASDSFKRAGFNWGIGRELYDMPLILLPLYANEFQLNQRSKKYQQTYDLKLREWMWHLEHDEHGKPNKLAAVDKNSVLRFEWSEAKGSTFIDLNKAQEQKSQRPTSGQPRIDPEVLADQVIKKLEASTNLGQLRTHFEGAKSVLDRQSSAMARVAEVKERCKQNLLSTGENHE